VARKKEIRDQFFTLVKNVTFALANPLWKHFLLSDSAAEKQVRATQYYFPTVYYINF
jgi:hypothetical protein